MIIKQNWRVLNFKTNREWNSIHLTRTWQGTGKLSLLIVHIINMTKINFHILIISSLTQYKFNLFESKTLIHFTKSFCCYFKKTVLAKGLKKRLSERSNSLLNHNMAKSILVYFFFTTADDLSVSNPKHYKTISTSQVISQPVIIIIPTCKSFGRFQTLQPKSELLRRIYNCIKDGRTQSSRFSSHADQLLDILWLFLEQVQYYLYSSYTSYTLLHLRSLK